MGVGLNGPVGMRVCSGLSFSYCVVVAFFHLTFLQLYISQGFVERESETEWVLTWWSHDIYIYIHTIKKFSRERNKERQDVITYLNYNRETSASFCLPYLCLWQLPPLYCPSPNQFCYLSSIYYLIHSHESFAVRYKIILSYFRFEILVSLGITCSQPNKCHYLNIYTISSEGII